MYDVLLKLIECTEFRITYAFEFDQFGRKFMRFFLVKSIDVIHSSKKATIILSEKYISYMYLFSLEPNKCTLKPSSDDPVENMNACFLCHEKMIVSIHSERGYLTQKMQNQIWIHTNCDHAIARCALELENLAIIIITESSCLMRLLVLEKIRIS